MKGGITDDEMWAVGMYLGREEGLWASVDYRDGGDGVLTKVFVCEGYCSRVCICGDEECVGEESC